MVYCAKILVRYRYVLYTAITIDYLDLTNVSVMLP